MGRTQLHIESSQISAVRNSANRLGATLASQQLVSVRQSYEQSYKAGVQNFWAASTHDAIDHGEEIARLQLENRRIIVRRMLRSVLLFGVLPGLPAWMFFGLWVASILLIASVGLGFLLILRK